MPPETQGNRLPFEPSKKRQKNAKNKNQPPETAKKPEKQPQNSLKSDNKLPETTKKAEQKPKSTTEEMAIPKIVSDRMARRMALLCGVPTALGMVTFVVSYFVVSHHWFKIPNVAVVLASMGFFGLGVLGLSYGVLSASWDEEIPGSKVGWQEFRTNWGRMTAAWRSNRQKNV